MATLGILESEAFVKKHKPALIKLINNLWSVQIDTLTQERVLAALANDGIPLEWVQELEGNIALFSEEVFGEHAFKPIKDSGKFVAKEIATDFVYVSENQSVYEFIKKESFELAEMLRGSLKNNFKEMIHFAVDEGLSVTELSGLLKGSMTLTARENRAVKNFTQKLLGRTDPPLSKKRINILTKNYYKKLQRFRSDRIARTELTRLKHFGENDSFNQAVKNGAIKSATKTWRRGNFNDNWDSSIGNDGVKVGINDQFPVPCQTGNAEYPSEINEYCFLEYDVTKGGA